MYGPEGLRQIASAVVEHCGNRPLSLTLEIHPTFEQLPLGDAAGLFSHWVDKTNAEKMNQWLGVLAANQALLQKTLKDG